MIDMRRGARLLLFGVMIVASIPAIAEDNQKPQKGIKVDDKGNLTLDLRQIEIKSFINLMAKLNKLIAIMGDDVKGKVSIYAPKKLDMTEAFEVLMAVLDSKGFTIIKTDQFLKVVRKNEAVQKPIEVRFGADVEDIPNEDRVITQVIPIEYVDANEILTNLRPLISTTGNAFVNKETNSLILTDIATNIRRMLTLVNHLDKEQPPPEKAKTVVYAIRYMKAKELGDALEKVFSGRTSADASKKVSEFKITPVEAVNSIIITAAPDLHPEIQETLDKLDIRRRQVLIEVTIAEATFIDGMSFSAFLKSFIDIDGGTTHSVSFGSGGTNPFVTYSLTEAQVEATFDAIRQDDELSILSSPRLLTMDNEKAKIVVGQEQPIVKSSTAVAESSDTVTDFVFKDVGIELEVTPQINVDRDVSLDISFKITSILRFETLGGEQQPVIGKREAESRVAVQDGNTLVIGGLIENNTRDLRNKVPFLGSIPLLGWLFSNTRVSQEQTELLVFITPFVVANSEEGTEITKKEAESASILKQAMEDKKKDE